MSLDNTLDSVPSRSLKLEVGHFSYSIYHKRRNGTREKPTFLPSFQTMETFLYSTETKRQNPWWTFLLYEHDGRLITLQPFAVLVTFWILENYLSSILRLPDIYTSTYAVATSTEGFLGAGCCLFRSRESSFFLITGSDCIWNFQRE